jgi:hypothetical protein
MAEVRFDPAQSIQFDLARGRVALDTADSRLLIPTAALMSLCQSAGQDAVRDFGRIVGAEAGRRVADRLQRELETATVADLVEHLGGDLALIGVGSLGAERWGRALVLIIEDSPFAADGDAFLAALLEGALQRVFVRSVSVIALHRGERRSRFLVLNASAATAVRSWISNGVPWGDVLTKLNDSGKGQA